MSKKIKRLANDYSPFNNTSTSLYSTQTNIITLLTTVLRTAIKLNPVQCYKWLSVYLTGTQRILVAKH